MLYSSKIIDLIPDALLPTDNHFEIPTLSLDAQPRAAERPVLCYGEQRRSKDMHGQGILHFYTGDYRFNSVFEHPEKILRHNPGAVVEPNCSLFNETPVAFGLQLIYKKRWIARALQDRGIPVFVDLNVSAKWSELNLLGVPEGYGAFATRGYSDRIDALEYEYGLATRIAKGTPDLFLVYGGGRKAQEWCFDHQGAIYLSPVIIEKNRRKAIERMKHTAILPEELKLPATNGVETP